MSYKIGQVVAGWTISCPPSLRAKRTLGRIVSKQRKATNRRAWEYTIHWNGALEPVGPYSSTQLSPVSQEEAMSWLLSK